VTGSASCAASGAARVSKSGKAMRLMQPSLVSEPPLVIHAPCLSIWRPLVSRLLPIEHASQHAGMTTCTHAAKQSCDVAHAERWPSGRRRTPGKCVWVKSSSRVRIPPAPPTISSNVIPECPKRLGIQPFSAFSSALLFCICSYASRAQCGEKCGDRSSADNG
jgi:hypothetical protein